MRVAVKKREGCRAFSATAPVPARVHFLLLFGRCDGAGEGMDFVLFLWSTVGFEGKMRGSRRRGREGEGLPGAAVIFTPHDGIVFPLFLLWRVRSIACEEEMLASTRRCSIPTSSLFFSLRERWNGDHLREERPDGQLRGGGEY